MQLQIIHGAQKYNLDLPDNKETLTSGKEKVEKELDAENQENGGQSEEGEWTIKKLKEEIEKVTGVPVDGQRLIRKGATLFGDVTPLASLNFSSGEKIMVLGQKAESVEDPVMKSLFTIEKTVLQGIENKMKDVDGRVQGIHQGYLTKELVSPSLHELDKQLKVLAEDCMKTLELMDAMPLGSGANDKARTKRKSLVKQVQGLLRWHDELAEQLEMISADMNPKGRQVVTSN